MIHVASPEVESDLAPDCRAGSQGSPRVVKGFPNILPLATQGDIEGILPFCLIVAFDFCETPKLSVYLFERGSTQFKVRVTRPYEDKSGCISPL
ncbi:MAG: hypothetical protein AAFO91_16750, partial [Bacteroidota bacterium]